ncbi:MAG: LCP family protein [Spirochaetaceae bacterium]|jgi:anionic cell wall polymer biosynthesis LytR-Cps2A-Psr (LCP) family protein|nr:LCP family protein [Spirochaetaceae bacterium]
MKRKTHAVKQSSSGLLLAGILVLVVGGIAGGYFLVRSTTLEDALSGDRITSALFIIENGGKPFGTYVFFCYPSTRRGALFAIPQNVGLIIRTLNRVDRIDSVYDPARPEIYRREVERLLGITVPYLVVINMEGLCSLVDLIEGVELNIPEAVAGFHQDPPVLLPSGRVVLDGNKVQAYLGYNAPDDDVEQILLKRERFFLGLIKRIGEKQALLSNPGFKKYFYASLRTTMSPHTIDRLFETLTHIDIARVTTQTVSGNYRDVSGERLLFPYYDGNLIKDIVSEALSGLTRISDSVTGDRVFTVEVLNGTSTTGLAGRTAELLRGFGYDVINVGNADGTQYDKTIVVDRSGTAEFGRLFADIIRCETIRVESYDGDIDDEGIGMTEEDTGYEADFTLILGRDFNGRYVNQ